jgi:hypothetical protein
MGLSELEGTLTRLKSAFCGYRDALEDDPEAVEGRLGQFRFIDLTGRK